MVNLEAIKRLAAEEMEHRSSHAWKERGNKFYHGERTAKLAVALRGMIVPDDDSHDAVLTAASWLHDVCNAENEPVHWEAGARWAKTHLDGLCGSEELQEICTMIALHDDRSPAHSGYSVWVRLLQDADLLDHFGSYDVWMNFAYGAAVGQTLEQMLEFLEKKRPSENERYLGKLNFAVSRRIFAEKAEFLRGFAERFRAECSGEICNAARIMQNEERSV